MAQRRKVIVLRDPCSALAAQLVAQGGYNPDCSYSPSYRPKGIFSVNAMDLHKDVHSWEEYAAVPAMSWKFMDVMMREKTPGEFVRWVTGIDQHFDRAICTDGAACPCCTTYADALPGIRTIVKQRLLSPETIFRVAACAVVHGMEPLLGEHVDPADVQLADCSPGDLLQLVARLVKDIQTDEAFAAFCIYPFDGLACMHLVPEYDAAFAAAARKLLKTALTQQSALDARRIQARALAGELIAQEEEEKEKAAAAAAVTNNKKKSKTKKSKAAATAAGRPFQPLQVQQQQAPPALSSRKLAVQQKRAVAAEACARTAVLAETARRKRMEEKEAAARRMLRESRCESRVSRKQAARADAADVAGALALLESMALEHLPEPPQAQATGEEEDRCGICMARGAATVRCWPCAHATICDVCAVDTWFRGAATLQCLSCLTPVSCMTLGNGRRLGIGSF